MQRDFSESARQDLKSLCKQVDDEKWNKVSDWFGDRYLDLRSLVGELKIDNYLDRVDSYHKLVIDKNNTTAERIDAIFNEVYAVDGNFVSRFGAAQVRLENYIALVQQVAEAIDPSKSRDLTAGTSGLDALFDLYEEQDAALEEICSSDNGISSETLNKMSEEGREQMLNRIVSNVIDYIPDISVDGTFELAIGMGVTLYYTVKGDYDGASDAEIDFAIEDGRGKLKEFKLSKDAEAGELDSTLEYSQDDEKKGMSASIGSGDHKIEGSIDSDGGASIKSSNGTSSTTIDTDGITATYTFEHDNATFIYKDGVKFKSAEVYAEESVKVKAGDGTVTSTIGIKASADNKWRTVPEPVPVREPVRVTMPEMTSEQWGYVAIGTAAAIFIVGVALAPYTGGGSLVLCTV